jgi:hypothetical protein
MELINKDSYLNIARYNQLTLEISNNVIEISNLENKKKSNQAILDLQENIYSTTIKNKIVLLKKYKFFIIKNLLIFIKNKNIISILNKIINNNALIIVNINKKINDENIKLDINSKINSEKNKITKLNKLYNNKESDKIYNLAYIFFKRYISNKNNLLKFINNSLDQELNITKKDIKLNNINFMLYLYKNINNNYNQLSEEKLLIYIYNLLNFIYYLNIYKYQTKFLYIELKQRCQDIKSINKLKLNNNKLLKNINKTYLKNESLDKKCKVMINKYKYNEKIINNQYIKYYKIQIDFIKNITDINLNIIILKQHIEVLNKKKDKLEEILLLHNKKYYNFIDIQDNCSICLNNLDYCIQTKCSHYFHYSCIVSYIYNIIEKYTVIELLCPICRQYI